MPSNASTKKTKIGKNQLLKNSENITEERPSIPPLVTDTQIPRIEQPQLMEVTSIEPPLADTPTPVIEAQVSEAQVPSIEPPLADTPTPVIEAQNPSMIEAGQKKRKIKKDNNKNKKPRAPSSYVLFAKEFRLNHKDDTADKSLGEVSKLCGEAWKEISSEEKNRWKAQSEERRIELEKSWQPQNQEDIEAEKKKKRKPTSYILFCKEERQKILCEFPGLSMGDISKKCGEAWKLLSEETRDEWKCKAATIVV